MHASPTHDIDSTDSKPLRELLGDLAHASCRPCERLEIAGMRCGPLERPATTEAHPIVRIDLYKPNDPAQTPLRLGAISARPTYDHGAVASTYTEDILEADLTGYVVHLELAYYPEIEGMAPYDIDYDALGFTERDPAGNLYDFVAHSERLALPAAVERVRQAAEALREARE